MAEDTKAIEPAAAGTILLFTRAAKIGNETRKLLVKAGYIPIEVTDIVGTVRTLSAVTIPAARLDIVSQAALKAISAFSDGPPREFGKLLAAMLTREEARPKATE